MSSRLVLRATDLGHGYGIYILLDIARRWKAPNMYFIALTYQYRIYRHVGPVSWSDANEVFDSYVWADGPRSWRAVLDRLMGKVAEQPGCWEGSLAQRAAQLYPVGSWEWVQILMQYRQLKEKSALSAPS